MCVNGGAATLRMCCAGYRRSGLLPDATGECVCSVAREVGYRVGATVERHEDGFACPVYFGSASGSPADVTGDKP